MRGPAASRINYLVYEAPPAVLRRRAYREIPASGFLDGPLRARLDHTLPGRPSSVFLSFPSLFVFFVFLGPSGPGVGEPARLAGWREILAIGFLAPAPEGRSSTIPS